MRNRLLSITRKVIPYIKELRPKVKTVTACLFMQQLDYWFNKQPDGFYKFIEPCEGHPLYKEGDSWAEELGFSAEEIKTAFSHIGIAYKSKDDYKKAEHKFISESGVEKFYCSYYDRQIRVIFYFRNHALVDKFLDEVLERIEEEEREDSQKPATPVSRKPTPPVLETVNPSSKKPAAPVSRKPTTLVSPSSEITDQEITQDIRSRIQVNQDKGIVEGNAGDKSNQGLKPSEQEKPPSPPKPAPVPAPLPESRGTSVRSGKDQIDLTPAQLKTVKELFDWTCDLLSPGEPHQKDWPDIAWLVSKGMGVSEGKALYQELIDSGLALAHWGMVRSKFGLERARSKRADPVPSRPPAEPIPNEPIDTSQALALIEVIDQVQYQNRSKRLPTSKLEELVREVCLERQIPFDSEIFLEFGRGRR